MKKLLSILLVGMLSVGMTACGNSKDTAKKDDTSTPAPTETKKEEPTREELNEKLKKEAVKADFVKLNGHSKENKDLKVFAEGKISIVDYKNTMDLFPSFTLTQEEGTGVGMYHITNILSVEGLKDGDTVKIYGVVDEEPSKAGLIKITATIIEKKDATVSKKVDKDKLKADIDKIVTQDLKGKSYSLDLLTPNKNADQGYIISIQVDNASFAQEDACKKYANEFLSALSKMESVYSVDMNFISNSKLTFGFRIEDWNSVKNNDNKLQNVEFQKF
ncbi:hypothetical protein [Clostridium cadaveris]|uniref:hypothetical protein n=1 Tax=Clostridium cadaveris TaxID=1529 RepID=UPI001981C700|nr:hypothetical protein [Clostridium cadaveris]